MRRIGNSNDNTPTDIIDAAADAVAEYLARQVARAHHDQAVKAERRTGAKSAK